MDNIGVNQESLLKICWNFAKDFRSVQILNLKKISKKNQAKQYLRLKKINKMKKTINIVILIFNEPKEYQTPERSE